MGGGESPEAIPKPAADFFCEELGSCSLQGADLWHFPHASPKIQSQPLVWVLLLQDARQGVFPLLPHEHFWGGAHGLNLGSSACKAQNCGSFPSSRGKIELRVWGLHRAQLSGAAIAEALPQMWQMLLLCLHPALDLP